MGPSDEKTVSLPGSRKGEGNQLFRTPSLVRERIVSMERSLAYPARGHCNDGAPRGNHKSQWVTDGYLHSGRDYAPSMKDKQAWRPASSEVDQPMSLSSPEPIGDREAWLGAYAPSMRRIYDIRNLHDQAIKNG